MRPWQLAQPIPLLTWIGVIEMDEIRQPVDARPDDRLSGGEAGAHRLEHLGVRPDLGVAVHAGLRRRDAGEVRGLDRGVAVAAVDAESADVMLMAERHRLLALDPLIGRVRRADHAADHPQHECDGEHSAEDRDAGESIGTSVENLRHLQAATSVGCVAVQKRRRSYPKQSVTQDTRFSALRLGATGSRTCTGSSPRLRGSA